MAVLLVMMNRARVGTRPVPAAPKAHRRHGLLLSNSADMPAGDKPPRYSFRPKRAGIVGLLSDTAQAGANGGRHAG